MANKYDKAGKKKKEKTQRKQRTLSVSKGTGVRTLGLVVMTS